MRRGVVVLTVVAAALAAPLGAAAHPLGNFTINRFSRVEVSGQHVNVRYVLDMAEIPTFQVRSTIAREGEARYARDLTRSIGSGLHLTAGRRVLPLRALDHELAFPPGQAGLRTLRFEAVFASPRLPGRVATRLVYRDLNYGGRVGWKEIVVSTDSGARSLGASVPANTISDELHSYPKSLLESPLDVTQASARIVTGTGTGEIPALIPRSALEERAGVRAVADSGFAALISKQHLSALVILAALGAAFFWGLAHALSPGHGKTIIAAYLIGQRGTVRHAAYLGGIVTVTHTAGVFALGLVTLLLSAIIVPEDLYPWLNLLAGLMVVFIGIGVLRARLGHRLAHARGHHHHHHHDHDHEHSHDHSDLSTRSLLTIGVSGGLLPCPSALVVLLAAISLHRTAFGLALVLAFSMGLALTITSIGLVAVLARGVFRHANLNGPIVRELPAVSAVVILVAGVLMTVRALPTVT
jgi:nickel/cobalt transporter (NicO) family protein